MSTAAHNLGEILTRNPERILLIGVAGSGMSGIAGLLLSLGHRVSGCDRVTTSEVERLQKLGLDFCMSETADLVENCQVVIYSSAVRPGNPVYDAALAKGLPMFLRAEALAAILKQKKGIVIAGMHGKTTTSSMAAHVLRAGGQYPSHYIGAEIPILGSNAHWDERGQYFVAEGDESDGTIALYHPEHTILLNVEEEHLDHYADLNAIKTTFAALLDQTRGTVLYCGDDTNAVQLCRDRPGSIAFGESEHCDYRFEKLKTLALQSVFEVQRRGERLGRVILNVPGRHNVSNATGVIALACELGIPFEIVRESLAAFRGAKRRFEEKYRSSHYLIIDDYAHHPSEIRATLETARNGTEHRMITLFQPHRYTRTQALLPHFADAFDATDILFVTDIYPASELPIPGVTAESIVQAIQKKGKKIEVFYEPSLPMARQAIGRILEKGDTVLSLGAGNVHEQTALLAEDVRKLEEIREAIGTDRVQLYEPLSKHTTLRVGGPAQLWAEPETVESFSRVVRYCNQTSLPLMVMGRGSNLLIRDGGVRGVVIQLRRGEFSEVAIDGLKISAGVGVPMKQISRIARDAEIEGFAWLEGIPGNVGGGLRMNAGAMGTEFFELVKEVTFVDRSGRQKTLPTDALEIHYRNVPFFKEHYAVSAVFEGTSGDRDTIERKREESLQKRRTSQPAASSAGCIFKNPKTIPAGKLVEELGLKNSHIGAARVSEVHGNFIVNDGGASAKEVLDLIEKIKSTALEQRRITLETEVQIVGEEDVR